MMSQQQKLKYSILRSICQHIFGFQHRGSLVSVQLKTFRCGNKPSSVLHIFTILLQRNPALRAKDPLITDNIACLCPKKANIGPVTGHNITILLHTRLSLNRVSVLRVRAIQQFEVCFIEKFNGSLLAEALFLLFADG